MASSEQRIARWRTAGMEAFNDGDVARMLAALTEDVEVYASPEMANAGSYTGIDGFVSWITAWTEAWDGDQRRRSTDNTPVGRASRGHDDPSGGPAARRDRGRAWQLAFLFDVDDEGPVHLPRDAARRARRRSGWQRSGETVLGADARAAAGRAGSRPCASGSLPLRDQQHDLVGREVAELVLERLSGVVIARPIR